ncbi:MATE family efflux transporter [Coraliomargarita sp. SDUM461004]|uniref:MATE family efflux transporter n=1 Tax=Thalassobacterium sedimentorum TaxID=3041258 RepID=A0ABU1AMC5_9BACT|nr:MATE family efflux transporter [Coraliomargarita sp. SDUM461004]MDQ8195941.1 MATE family efflux transporter [Coraliomargarita sp. SDUM461004]
MQTSHRVLKNTLILYGKTGITMFISLYTTRVVLRELGADSFGVFALIGGIIGMFGFLNGSLAAASQRFMSFAHGEGKPEQQQKIFNISFGLHFIAALIMVISMLSIGPLLFEHVLKIDLDKLLTAQRIYQFVVASLFFTVLSVPYDAVLNARENMAFFAIIGFIESLLRLGVAMAIAFVANEKLLLYGFLMAMIPLFLAFIRAMFCHMKYVECHFALRRSYDLALIKSMTQFASWSFISTAVAMVSKSWEGIILNTYFGTTINAAQGIANQLSGQLLTISNSLLRALNPILVKTAGERNNEKMLRTAMSGAKLSFTLLAFCIIPISINLSYICKLWLSSVPEFAIIFTQLLLFRSLIAQLSMPISTCIAASGKIKGVSITGSVIGLCPLAVCAILYKHGYQPPAIYWAYICTTIVRACITAPYFAKKHCGLHVKKFLINVVVRCIIGTGITLLASLWLKTLLPEGINQVMITSAVSSVLLIICVWYIILDQTEKEHILNAIQSAYTKLNRIIVIKQTESSS